MKKITLLFFVVLLSTSLSAQQKAKYVFYFIGDGMGLHVINATEHYKAFTEKNKAVTNVPLLFSSFPIMGIATTNAANRYITDSAAAGTALATGEKTSPGTIGMNTDHSAPLRSIAFDAKESSKAVGIVTSVSIDHATPASFYASEPSRNNYYEIAMDGVEAGFDLYGGSGFLNTTSKNSDKEVYGEYTKNGYTILRGLDNLSKLPSLDSKVVVTERDGASAESFAYAIDQTKDDMSLAALVENAIPYLEKKGGKNGFFLMAEGGKIDWAAHSNDGKAEILEVMDMDKAIAVAYEFYKKHPKETIIIVTADHETGGFSLGRGEKGYDLSLGLLDGQKVGVDMLNAEIVKNAATWEMCNSILEQKLGLNKIMKLSDSEMEGLQIAYVKKKGNVGSLAVSFLMEKSGLGFTSGTHTGSPVMVYAVGAGSEKFQGRQDNTDIPKKIKSLF